MENKYFLSLSFITLFAIMLTSCKSDDPETPTIDTETVYLPDREVYVSGWEVMDGLQKHVVWKNGEPSILENTPTLSTEASKVFVSGNNVYVAGYEGLKLCIWKNNQIIRYQDTRETSYAKQLQIINDNVYVLHSQSGNPAYTQRIWKDQQVMQTSTPGTNEHADFSLHSSDLYVTGKTKTTDNKWKGSLWKNNTVVNTEAINAQIQNFIFIDFHNNDRYMVGTATDESSNFQSHIFKNDQFLYSINTKYQIMNPIFRLTNNGDLYAAVSTNNDDDDDQITIHIYKNGQIISTIADKDKTVLEDFYVYNQSVYALLRVNSNIDDKRQMIIWMDGKKSPISTSTNRQDVFSIFVKEKSIQN